MKKTLEICIDSLASARAAIAGGADRLELCSALALGGLTPYNGLLAQIRKESDIQIRCLIRCRWGDFLYTKEEIQLMAAQIRQLKELGADGFVIGCLTEDGFLDKEAMKPLIEAAKGCGLTLHRAIDVSRDLEKTYRDAASLGIDTVLTSGGAADCMAGKETIAKLLTLQETENGPTVLIGSGVNAKAIEAFRKEFPAACSFHMSGKMMVESGMKFRKADVPMGIPSLDEWHIQQTDPQAVAAARKALDA